MKLTVRSPKDFCSGLLFIAFGLAAVWLARSYPIGTAQSFGPGMAPTILGAVLGLAGLAISAVSLRVEGAPVPHFAWKPLVLVLGAVVAFASVLAHAGLVASTFVLIVTSALAGHDFRFKEVLVAATVLSTASVGLFVHGLKLQFPVWPW
ncbi:MAG: tripartite tricarboxylate transporter TctB family protein [Deltaproteobacteria bacterium]|nr:tripartite tricarboxylate transporter TctB family protein [Deltaproteobacteria bacterium]